MSIFVPNKVYLRGILLHYFIQKKSAAEAHRILVQTYDDNALSDTTCRDWFRRFKNNDFELEDKERSGASKKFQDKELEQLLDEDPSQMLSELGKILQVDESTVSKRLKGLGMIQKQGHWVPYELLLLCIWWDQQGVIYYIHDKVILLHDNARPHVAKPVKTYLETLKWEVLTHPLYSPDTAPSDFHLFRSMAHGLADRRFHSYEKAQKWIDSWIAAKDMSFFRRGIHVLPERWKIKSAAEADRILVQTYGDNALSDTTCRDWFRRFKNNDFQLEDKERSGAPKKFQDKELEQLLDEDPSQTLSELGKILQVDESTVSKRLKGLGMIQNQGHWVPRALKEKRPLYAQRHDKVILLHDIARPHVAKPVKTYLETLKWEVLPHPLYSPDIAPSDFHLFRSMAHGLAARRFHSYEEAQKWSDSWIASKDMSFFRRGIHILPER
ncbi:MOS1T transposase, partial [Pseudoatta argentina]